MLKVLLFWEFMFHCSPTEIDALCRDAEKYNFASVCINPTWVTRASHHLAKCPVRVCTVIGFPLGACAMATKVAAAKQAIEDGADEIDMVLNVGALKSGFTEHVQGSS